MNEKQRRGCEISPTIGQERKHDVDVIGAIRQAVSEDHELQVYAIVLLKPGSLPKTSSGKIQRYACKARFLENDFEPLVMWRVGAADDTEKKTIKTDTIEEWLINALAARIGVNPCDINREHKTGVNSLMAVDLTHAIETSHGVSLSVADVLQSSVAQLAAR